MAAFQRGRRTYFQRRRNRRSQKILSKRRKLHSRQQRRMRTKRVMRSAKSRYQKKHLPMSRYYNRRITNNVLSSRKVKHTMTSYRSKGYHRKPLRTGRPRKKKHYINRSGLLRAKLKKRICKKCTRRKDTSDGKKAKRKPRYSDDEIFYSLANSSTPKGALEERQTMKHSVHFTTPGNTKTKEMEQQEDLSVDNQSSQQTVTPKKRNRPSATSIYKSH